MAANDKDTIYIDIDDEITGVIDKVKSSPGKVVALVLPKRAAVFQSIVNMKLLKRAADDSKKHIALITTEAGLLPLAGAAGIHVAKTLNGKPEIPQAPEALAEPDTEETIEEDPDAETPIDASKSVGALAGGAVAADGVETLMLDDDELPEEAGPDTPPKSKSFEPPKDKKAKKSKKLAVPNFERFRLWLILGGLLLLLIIGGFVFATFAMPKATITVKTDATKVDTSLGLNMNTAAKQLNVSNGTIPAKTVQTQKTYTAQVPTTGQKNNGNKASGSVGLQNCSPAEGDVTIPAGTGLSSNGNTYITQESVTLPESSFSGGDRCKTPRVNVDVMAQSGGSSYNGANTFSVAGYPNVKGTVSDSISGGTDSIVQTVNQNDVNTAKSKISPNDSELRQTLASQLKKDGYYPIEATYSGTAPAVTTSANVGDVANNLTVTENVTYTMFGVKQSDLEKLVENSIKDQIDPSKQSLLDSGLSKANYNVDNMTATTASVTMSTVATAGPDLDEGDIKNIAAGKKAGPVREELENNPDVKSVNISVSPFWIKSIPKKQDRITVHIAEPEKSTNSSNSNGNSP